MIDRILELEIRIDSPLGFFLLPSHMAKHFTITTAIIDNVMSSSSGCYWKQFHTRFGFNSCCPCLEGAIIQWKWNWKARKNACNTSFVYSHIVRNGFHLMIFPTEGIYLHNYVHNIHEWLFNVKDQIKTAHKWCVYNAQALISQAFSAKTCTCFTY